MLYQFPSLLPLDLYKLTQLYVQEKTKIHRKIMKVQYQYQLYDLCNKQIKKLAMLKYHIFLQVLILNRCRIASTFELVEEFLNKFLLIQ